MWQAIAVRVAMTVVAVSVILVIALVYAEDEAIKDVLEHKAVLQAVAIIVFFGLDVMWRRLVITEGGYLVADLSLFAVLESGFLLAHKAGDAGGEVTTTEVFKVLVALALYLLLLSILSQLKQRNIDQMAKGFADLVNALSRYHDQQLVDSSTDADRAEVMRRRETQRESIELVRQMAFDTVWVTVFSYRVRGARGDRARRIVDLLKELSGEEFLQQKTVKVELDTFYLTRNLVWSILAGLCTLSVLAAAVYPVP